MTTERAGAAGMARPAGRTSARTPVRRGAVATRRALVLLAVATMTLLAPGVAAATTPLDVGDRITDQVGVLARGTSALDRSLADLEAATGVRLYVVVVDSFETTTSEGWAQETAHRSALGSTDMLVAVAVDETSYVYDWWLGTSFPLGVDEVDAVITDDVETEMDAGNWAEGLTVLADRMQAEMTTAELDVSEFAAPTWTRARILAVVGGALTVLLVGHVLSRRSSSGATTG